jgi:hypothetical protein
MALEDASKSLPYHIVNTIASSIPSRHPREKRMSLRIHGIGGQSLARCPSPSNGPILRPTITTTRSPAGRLVSPARAHASEDGKDTDEEDIQIEKMMSSKRKSRKGQAAEPAKPFTVVSATRDSVYGDQPPSQIQQVETTVVQGLGLLFALILAEGIFLGASGFMSAEMDALAQDVVYPLFTPTLGVFLAGSSAYGLWKTREDTGSSN